MVCLTCICAKLAYVSSPRLVDGTVYVVRGLTASDPERGRLEAGIEQFRVVRGVQSNPDATFVCQTRWPKPSTLISHLQLTTADVKEANTGHHTGLRLLEACDTNKEVRYYVGRPRLGLDVEVVLRQHPDQR